MVSDASEALFSALHSWKAWEIVGSEVGDIGTDALMSAFAQQELA